MRKFSQVLLIVFGVSVMAGACTKYPDAHYVGVGQAGVVETLRSKFYNFELACKSNSNEEEADEMLGTVLAVRDELRAKLHLTDKQRNGLSSELDCLIQDGWTCSGRMHNGWNEPRVYCGSPTLDE